MVSASMNADPLERSDGAVGVGRAEPLSVTLSPGSPSVSERVWSGPAFAVGIAGALTVITTSSLAEADFDVARVVASLPA